MIRINVFIQVPEAHHAEVLKIAQELAAKSILEVGCIAYDVFKSSTRFDVLMICETWKDEVTLEAHENTELFKTSVTRMQNLAAVKLEKFNF